VKRKSGFFRENRTKLYKKNNNLKVAFHAGNVKWIQQLLGYHLKNKIRSIPQTQKVLNDSVEKKKKNVMNNQKEYETFKKVPQIANTNSYVEHTESFLIPNVDIDILRIDESVEHS